MKIGSKKGFTLIELLIVIAIIGILAVALLPSILGAPAKGRDAARKAHLNAISTALEAANLDLSGYPLSGTGTAQQVCISNAASGFSTRTAYVQGGTFPTDPLGATNGPSFGKTGCQRGQYLFTTGTGTGGKNYSIMAYMEVAQNANTAWGSVKALAAGQDAYPTALVQPTGCGVFTQATGILVDGSCIYYMQK